MKTGVFTQYTNFGMMPTMITSSVSEEHRRVWPRGKIRELFSSIIDSSPFPASVRVTPDTVTAGRRSTVTIAVTAGCDIPTGSHVTLLLPEFWGGIHQERDCTTFFIWKSPDTYPGYISSHISAQADDACAIEGTITTSGSVHTVVDVVVLNAPLRKGHALSIVIGDACGLPVLPIDFTGTYRFSLAVDAGGGYAPILPVPSIRVTGGTAARYRVTVPAVSTAPEAAVVPIDRSLNTADADAGTVRVVDRGTFRDVVVVNDTLAISGISNPSVASWTDGMNVYFGEIHSHTELSDGIATTDDAYSFARDTLHLDFAALSDHFERHLPSVCVPGQERWAMTKAAAEKYYDPGRFVTLLGYEWTGRPHINIYYRGNDGLCVPAQASDAGSPAELFRKLDVQNMPYLAIPHHTKYLAAADWGAATGRENLLEIYSGWGASEDGNDSAFRAAITRGLRLGVIAGTDDHIGRPGQGNRTFEGGGLACVLAKEKTREAVFDALLARRCYGTTGARILVDFSVNGMLMGGVVKSREKNFIAVRAIGEDIITSIEIIRNGLSVLYRKECTSQDASCECKDGGGSCYYARITQRDGHIAWTSPVWTF